MPVPGKMCGAEMRHRKIISQESGRFASTSAEIASAQYANSPPDTGNITLSGFELTND